MILKTIKIILGLLIILLVSYFVTQNSQPINVKVAPTYDVDASIGLVLMVVFALGIICASLVAGYLGVKGFFREKGLERRERKIRSYYKGMLEARNHLASKEWKKAKNAWEKIIKTDPTDIISRVELSKSLQGEGKTTEALKVLDKARAADPTNAEVLFRAAELNLELKNKTAAIDNLALILYHHPNKLAATLARDLSEDIGRFQDALEYQKQAESLGSSKDYLENRTKLTFKKLCANLEDKPEFKIELEKFVKKNPEYVPALSKLAELEKENDNFDKAAQILVKAAKLDGSDKLWDEAANLWIDNDMPGRAIAAARSATKDTKGKARLHSEIDLIRMYLSLNMMEEANDAIINFDSIAKDVGVNLNHEQEIQYEKLVLKGLCLNQMGKHKESAEIWKRLINKDFKVQKISETHIPKNLNGAPAPKLSTP